MRHSLLTALFAVLAAAAPAAAQTPQSLAEVSDWYQRFLHRPMDPAGNSWASALDQGQNPEKILAGILGSDEFYNNSGGTESGYVQTLFADLVGRGPSPAELNYWLNQLTGIGGVNPAYEARVDLAYNMLVRYPQDVQAAPDLAVPPTITVPVAPPVIVPRIYDYRRPDYRNYHWDRRQPDEHHRDEHGRDEHHH